METKKMQALSDFYREEFLRHLEHLKANGVARDENRVMQETCHRLIKDLDRVCSRAEFRQVAEVLLQNFDALTGLSTIEPPPIIH